MSAILFILEMIMAVLAYNGAEPAMILGFIFLALSFSTAALSQNRWPKSATALIALNFIMCIFWVYICDNGGLL